MGDENNIWVRNGNQAVLALQYDGQGTIGPQFSFTAEDLLHDNDAKLVALQTDASGPADTVAVDIIEETGRVVAHLNLGAGGQVALSSSPPGLITWSHQSASATKDLKQVISYSEGAWRIVSNTIIPTAEAPSYPNGDGL